MAIAIIEISGSISFGFFDKRTPIQRRNYDVARKKLEDQDSELLAQRERLTGVTDDLLGIGEEYTPGEPGSDALKISAILHIAFMHNVFQRERLHRSFENKHDDTVDLSNRNSNNRFDLTARPAINRHSYGISPAELFGNGQSLAQRDAAAVVGHFLTIMDPEYTLDDHTEPYPDNPVLQTSEAEIAQAYAELPALTHEELLRLQNTYPQLAGDPIQPARQLALTYHDAVRNVRRDALSIKSPSFEKIFALFEAVDERGSDRQFDMLIKTLVPPQDKNTASATFRRMSQMINAGEHVDYVTTLKMSLAKIYDAKQLVDSGIFDGLLVDETEAIDDVKKELLALKAKLLRQVPDARQFTFPEESIPGSDITRPEGFVEVIRGKDGPLVQVGFNTQSTEGEPISITLLMNGNSTIDWNIVNTTDDLPEAFYSLAVQGRGLLKDVLDSLQEVTGHHNRQKEPLARSTPVFPGHAERIFTEAVDEMNRLDEIAQELLDSLDLDSDEDEVDISDPEDMLNGQTHPGAVDQSNGNGHQNGNGKHRPPLRSNDQLMSKLGRKSHRLHAQTKEALDEYPKGKGEWKPMKKAGPNGERMSVLRNGDVRIFFYQDSNTGEIYPIDAKDRDEAYRRYKI